MESTSRLYEYVDGAIRAIRPMAGQTSSEDAGLDDSWLDNDREDRTDPLDPLY